MFCILQLAAATAPALANPTGPAVVAGSATFATSGGTLTVTNAHNTVINWQGFSIGAGETTRFNQPAAASMVLNRVVTAAPSSILGSLTSNGGVFLVNPNGVIFGAGSQVQVGAFTVSTSDITDANFLAGNYVFAPGGGGSIAGGGTIQATGPITVNSNSTQTSLGGIINSGATVTLSGTNSGTSGNLVITGTTVTVGGAVSTGSTILTGGKKVGTFTPGNLVVRIAAVAGAPSAGGRLIAAATTGAAPAAAVGLRLEKRDLAF